MREFFIARARADKPLKFYISFYEIVFHLFHDLYYIIKEWTGNYAGFYYLTYILQGQLIFLYSRVLLFVYL